MGFYRNFCF